MGGRQLDVFSAFRHDTFMEHNTVKPVWQEEFTMRFWDVDKTDRLTLSGTFDLFQEVAIVHSEQLGVGRDILTEKKQAWILSRMSVLIERRPLKGETILVRTWPRGAEKLFAMRDFDIRDKDNNTIVRGRSAWLVLDTEKHRPLRPQPLMETMPENKGMDALPDGALGIDAEPGIAQIAVRKAGYSDIDYNGHVNNARYVQWIQDIMDPGLLYGAAQMRLDINYLSEVKPGETIEMWSGPVLSKNGTNAVEGKHADTGAAAFRAELWTGR